MTPRKQPSAFRPLFKEKDIGAIRRMSGAFELMTMRLDRCAHDAAPQFVIVEDVDAFICSPQHVLFVGQFVGRPDDRWRPLKAEKVAAISRELPTSKIPVSTALDALDVAEVATAKKILTEMEKLFAEVTEQKITHSLQMQFNLGYGAAMSDLRHVLGDLFPSMKQ